MNPFNLTLAQYIMQRIVYVFLEKFKELERLQAQYAAEWSENAAAADFLAAEALVDVENGEVAVWGDFDTNDVRRLDALTNAFEAFLDANVTTTLANEDTEVKTARQMIVRFYGPYQG